MLCHRVIIAGNLRDCQSDTQEVLPWFELTCERLESYAVRVRQPGRTDTRSNADLQAHAGVVVTLLEHLHLGEWDQALPLIDRALRAGVRVRHIPPPSGHTSWRDEDYKELLAEFVADGRGPARLIQLAVSATDDQHVRGLLGTTIKRFLADRAREDPLPKLRRTLRAVLERMPEAVFVDKGTVSLALHCERDRWAGDETELLAVATSLAVAAPPWGQDTIREGPPTDRASFESLCTAILDAAGGPVSLNALTRTIGQRLQLRRSWDDRQFAQKALAVGDLGILADNYRSARHERTTAKAAAARKGRAS